jgi:hypothetical protein
MPQDALTVQHDGTLTVLRRPDEDTAALEAALSGFTDLVCPTAGQRVNHLTGASIWRARREGLALEGILETLATYSTTEFPPRVRAAIERWSRQIDRPTLKADHGRLLLRSPNPLALTAVRRHRTLGAFITPQLDATTVELRPATYPELVHTFDDCGYPVLDRVPAEWKPDEVSALPAASPARSVVQALPLPVQTGGRRAALVEGLHRLPRQCQATTKAGRQCKNRTQSASMFCRVHTEWSTQAMPPATYTPDARLASQFLEVMLETRLMTLLQLAVYRVVVLMGIGLLTWLLSLLLLRLSGARSPCRSPLGG